MCGCGPKNRISLPTFSEWMYMSFIRQYTRVTWDRHALSLTEQPDGACIFLTPEGWPDPGGKAPPVQQLSLHLEILKV